ncbi:MAG: hypothetical protein QNJ44_19750 [Rhodobacter sp.]|nr:hypothetical protein [Rhodobacter sp.]
MLGNVKASLGRAATNSNAVAQTVSQGTYLLVFGLLLMLVMTPDGIVVYQFTADGLRDPESGRLSDWGHALAIITALATVVAIALAIHWLYRFLSEIVRRRIYLWMGIVALIIVLAQPLIMQLAQGGIGGNSVAQAAGSQSDWTASEVFIWAASLARAGLFPLYAIVGTIGLGMAIEGWNRRMKAREAMGDSIVQHTAMKEINEGQKLAKMARHTLQKKTQRMRMRAADMLNTAANGMADHCQLYLKGDPSTLTQASFLQSVDDMVKASDSPNTQALAQIVKMHLPEALPLNVLPVDGRTLPDAAKREIQEYIQWIRVNYRRKRLLEAI